MATPEEIAAHLNRVKVDASNTLIAHLNSLTANALNTYPQAEMATWPYQVPEAQAVITAGESATVEMAPLLNMVCEAHHGAADPGDRLAQIKAKAAKVLELSGAFLPMAAYVNGLRARAQEQIFAATEAVEVTLILEPALTESSLVISAAPPPPEA